MHGSYLFRHFSIFTVLSSTSPLTSTTLSVSFVTFFSLENIGGSMVCLPLRVVIYIQCPSFFRFWTMLLGRVAGCLVLTVADNWANCNSSYLIDIACVSTFFPIPAKLLLNSLLCSSLASNLLIILCNITSTRAILPPLSLGVTSRF